jgi:hypothetical protein
MYIVIKNITKLKSPQACHGKELAQKARECFVKNQLLTLDFEGVETIATEFYQELMLPMVAEFGADFLKSKLQVINVSPAVQELMQSAFKNLDKYFDKLFKNEIELCNQDIYDLNLAWLVMARQNARENAVNAQLIMGIADEKMRLAVSQLSMDDIKLIAQSGCLCFAPRFTTNFIQGLSTGRHDLAEILLALVAWI